MCWWVNRRRGPPEIDIIDYYVERTKGRVLKREEFSDSYDKILKVYDSQKDKKEKEEQKRKISIIDTNNENLITRVNSVYEKKD